LNTTVSFTQVSKPSSSPLFAKAFVIFGFLVAELRHGHATTGTGRANLSGQGSQKISSFSHRIRKKNQQHK